jgi:uncharacterized membrane protein
MQEKRYTVAVTRELHTAFKKLCRTNNLIGLKVIWALVDLYSLGDLKPFDSVIPRKPYKLWLQFRCGAGDPRTFQKALDQLKARMMTDGQGEVAAVLRGLVQAFVDRRITVAAWGYVVARARRKRAVPV